MKKFISIVLVILLIGCTNTDLTKARSIGGGVQYVEWGTSYKPMDMSDTLAGDILIVGEVDDSTKGTYVVEYYNGRRTEKMVFDVVVEDTIKPIISLTPPQDYKLFVGEQPFELDYLVFDESETTVEVISHIKDIPGIYTIDYIATDSSGNQAKKVVTVQVVDYKVHHFDAPYFIFDVGEEYFITSDSNKVYKVPFNQMGTLYQEGFSSYDMNINLDIPVDDLAYGNLIHFIDVSTTENQVSFVGTMTDYSSELVGYQTAFVHYTNEGDFVGLTPLYVEDDSMGFKLISSNNGSLVHSWQMVINEDEKIRNFDYLFFVGQDNTLIDHYIIGGAYQVEDITSFSDNYIIIYKSLYVDYPTLFEVTDSYGKTIHLEEPAQEQYAVSTVKDNVFYTLLKGEESYTIYSLDESFNLNTVIGITDLDYTSFENLYIMDDGYIITGSNNSEVGFVKVGVSGNVEYTANYSLSGEYPIKSMLINEKEIGFFLLNGEQTDLITFGIR